MRYDTGSANYGWYEESVDIDGNYAVVGDYSGRKVQLLKTVDNGESWTLGLTIGVSTDYVNFGRCVAINGNYMIVGARSYQNNKGAAYIFKTTDDWSTYTEQLITASNGAGSDNFGQSVTIDGNYAIVGAYAEDGPDNADSAAGAAYVFQTTDDGDTWTEVQILYASDIVSTEYFGYSVAISGNNAIIGAYYADDNDPQSGSAFIFGAKFGIPHIKTSTISAKSIKNIESDDTITIPAKSGTLALENDINNIPIVGFTETQKLLASDGEANDYFGYSVAIDGNYAIVGAYAEDGLNDAYSIAGAAYIYETKDGGITWTEVQNLRRQAHLLTQISAIPSLSVESTLLLERLIMIRMVLVIMAEHMYLN